MQVLLVASVFVALIASSVIAEPLCDINQQYPVPDADLEEDADMYNEFNARLQIFTQLKIPCDGSLSHWRYMTPQQIFGKVHLAVFRQRPNSPSGSPIFDIVGESYVKNEPPDWAPSAWVTAAIRPFNVLAGDVLGLYYDSVAMGTGDVMIPSITSAVIEDSETYLYSLDATTIKNRTVMGAFQTLQSIPAVSAIVTRYPPTTTTTSTPMTTIVTEPIRPKPTRSSRCFLPKPQLFSIANNGPSCFMPAWRSYFDLDWGLCAVFYGCSPPSNANEANNFDSVEACRRECPEAFIMATPGSATPSLPFINRFQISIPKQPSIPLVLGLQNLPEFNIPQMPLAERLQIPQEQQGQPKPVVLAGGISASDPTQHNTFSWYRHPR